MEVVVGKKRPNGGLRMSKQQLLIQVWTNLQPAMVKMFRGEDVDRNEYMKLYSLIYDFCSSGDCPAAKTGRFSGPHILELNSDEHSLYNRIQNFIVNKVKSLEPLLASLNIQDESQIIEFYVRYANSFFKGTKQLNIMCSPLHNTWLKKANDACLGTGSTRCNFHRIEHLAYMCWRKLIFQKLGFIVTNSVLSLIRKERGGENIKYDSISAVIASLLKIGYDADEVEKIQIYMKSADVLSLSKLRQEEVLKDRFESMELSFYRCLFETPFLMDAKLWLEGKVQPLLIPSVTSFEYFKEIFAIFNEEMSRAKTFFHRTTQKRVQDTIIKVAVSANHEKFFSVIPEIFDKYRDSEDWIKPVSNYLHEIHGLCIIHDENMTAYLNHLKIQILREVNVRLAKGATETGPLKSADLTMYVDTFQITYDAYTKVLMNGSVHDIVYKSTIQTGITEALTKNVIIENHKNYPSISEQSFARKFHLILTNKKLGEGVEKACDDFLPLYQLLPNMVAFEIHYCSYLTLRLVEKTSVSNGAEEYMLNKIESRSGIDIAGKMTKLFLEGTSGSGDLMVNFKKSQFYTEMPFVFDFTILPQLQCPWRVNEEAREFNIHIPSELAGGKEAFGNFYASVHADRKLLWLHDRSKGELETKCFKKPKKYTIVCSVYQMAVILLFNSVDLRSFEDILTYTGLTVVTASQIIFQLVRSKLLILEKKDNTDTSSELKKEDVVKLNLEFFSKNVRINLNTVVKMEQDQKDDEKASNEAAVATSHIIQATIARLMKASQKMTHTQLVTEVIAESIRKSRGKTPIPFIKKAIDMLIEKDYIKRDDKDSNTYIYIS